MALINTASIKDYIRNDLPHHATIAGGVAITAGTIAFVIWQILANQ